MCSRPDRKIHPCPNTAENNENLSFQTLSCKQACAYVRHNVHEMPETACNTNLSALQPELFGADCRERVVGCEALDGQAIVFRRIGDGIVHETVNWRPWLICAQRNTFPGVEERKLQGEGYSWQYFFPSINTYRQARRTLEEAREEIIAVNSLERQFLIQTGITFFKNMVFEDAVRMQLDIETTTLSATQPGACILLVAVSDNKGFREAVIGDETAILHRLCEIIAQRNPDILEGHNIFGFDLPYLINRAMALGMTLNWGREGQAVYTGSKRNLLFGGMMRPFIPIQVPGRSVIDTMFGMQRYDVGRSELTSLGLKQVAQQLGVSAPDRVYLDRAKMEKLWRDDPQQVCAYALQDVYETGELARIAMPADFYVSQMAPDTYQGNAVSGTGEKINLLLIREYLRQGFAIPFAKTSAPVQGGFTELRRTGLLDRIVKCDVESLYPSLMLVNKIAPASDTLNIFLPILKGLTERRLHAKAQKLASNSTEKAYWDGLQSSFKILINSFFGYLGARFYFNDPDAAQRITSSGQDIVRQVVKELEKTGGTVIEVDTDGVYFQPPNEVKSEADEVAYIARISSALPEGIHLAHDGRWRAMISLKVKNYVLIGYDGRFTYKGTALRSRSDERFGQAFITSAVELIASGLTSGIRQLYLETMRQISEGELQVENFCRRERVTTKSLEGRSLQRAAGALVNMRPGDYVYLYRREDGKLALADEWKGDEDREYLKDKLYKFAVRLAPAIGTDFDSLCPAPGSRLLSEMAGQQKLDLF